MRRLSSFSTLLLLTGASVAGLAVLVLVNAPDIVRALAVSATLAPARFVHACILLFSLGPLEPALIVGWLLLLALLFWVSGRFLLEFAQRWRRTRLAIEQLRDGRVITASPEFEGRCARLGLAGRVEVLSLPAPTAFCYGLRAPRIVVSSRLLERVAAAELDAILLHEREHLTRRDPLRLLLGQSLAAAFKPLPVVPAVAARLATEQEVMADRVAVAAQGGAAHLAAALLRLLQGAGAELYPADLAISGLTATAARVEALVDPAKSQQLLKLPARSLGSGVLLLAAGALAGLVFTVTVHSGHSVHRCPPASPMAMTMMASCQR